jgi:hypothetical protein
MADSGVRAEDDTVTRIKAGVTGRRRYLFMRLSCFEDAGFQE